MRRRFTAEERQRFVDEVRTTGASVKDAAARLTMGAQVSAAVLLANFTWPYMRPGPRWSRRALRPRSTPPIDPRCPTIDPPGPGVAEGRPVGSTIPRVHGVVGRADASSSCSRQCGRDGTEASWGRRGCGGCRYARENRRPWYRTGCQSRATRRSWRSRFRSKVTGGR
jgi:hypothetical protein